MMQRRGVLLLTAGLAAPRLARAAWPDRPIRLVVPYGGGGQTDIVSRVCAEAVGRRLGQPVLPDNKPGGAGNLAAETVARAPADGHTVLVASMSTNSGLNALMYRQLGYDAARDLAPVGLFCTTANVLLVHRTIPGEGPAALLDWIRANPGAFTYGSAGVGAITHLAMELLADQLGLEMVHVPYRQSTQAMTDLLAGRIHARCLGLPEGEPVRDAASIRPVTVTLPSRSPAWPGVPALAEVVPGFAAQSYYGLSVPTGTPAEAVARLNAALCDALADPVVRAAFSRVGADPAAPNTPAEFAAHAAAERNRWTPLIRKLNLRAE